MYGIQTPNLATIAQPYHAAINDVISGAYGFKDLFRQDYLADRQLPAQAVAADLALLRNIYGVQDRVNTFGDDLAASSDQARLGAMGAAADLALYPQLRGLKDTSAIESERARILQGRQQAMQAQNSVLEADADRAFNALFQSAAGADALTKSLNAYEQAVGTNASPRVVSRAMSAAMDAARAIASVSVPGSEAHSRAVETLRRFGGYGVSAPSTVSAPPSGAILDDFFE